MDEFENWILKIRSNKKWKTCTIVACTHWDEPIWYYIFDYLLNNFNLKKNINKWNINLVIWNEKAMYMNKRFIDKDFNRIWDFSKEDQNTYEYNRAKEIKDILLSSDYVFDLHSTTSPSPFFLIPWDNIDNNIFHKFNVDFVIKNILDFLHWMPLVKYVEKNNYNSRCLVMEWYLKNKSDLNKAINNVLNYLNYNWFISNIEDSYYSPLILNTKKAIYANSMNIDFIYSKNPRSFDKITKWEIILKDNKKELFSDDDYYILMPTHPRYIWEEIWYLLK